ncbi:hypothetical protein RB200_04380 [Streptomyces sp. PmtG]
MLTTMAPPASAGTSYEDDVCSSRGNRYCFRIHYSSRSETTQQSKSDCFVANKSVWDHWGYTVSGGAHVIRYVFGSFPSDAYGGMRHPCSGAGGGQAAVDNAASAWNQDPRARYTVYSGSGYSGSKKTYPKADGIARNFSKTKLKNKNSSHKRTS